MKTMYDSIVNSPTTTLAAAVGSGDTTITVLDGTALPPAPNEAMIGNGEVTETILYAFKNGNTLSNVTRGFQGTAAAWNAGTTIARLFSDYDFAAFKENILELRPFSFSDTIPANKWVLKGGQYEAEIPNTKITTDMNMIIGLSGWASINNYIDMGIYYGITFDGGYILYAVNAPEAGTSINIFAEVREVY